MFLRKTEKENFLTHTLFQSVLLLFYPFILCKCFAEDNFFGPVSANFIRPERLSDSAASDDITMDSTAFSMHFRSLARSDSGGGELKTPTTAHRLLAFEDNATPSRTDSYASFMVLTKTKKLSVDQVSSGGGGKDSNEMSIVGENPRSYDYGRLSPRLDALLAEGSKDLHAVPIDSRSLMRNEDAHDMVSPIGTKMSEANGGSSDSPARTPKQLTGVSKGDFFFSSSDFDRSVAQLF